MLVCLVLFFGEGLVVVCRYLKKEEREREKARLDAGLQRQEEEEEEEEEEEKQGQIKAKTNCRILGSLLSLTPS